MTGTLDDFLAASEANYLRKLRAKKPRGPRDPMAPKKKRGNPERTAQQAVVKWLRAAGCIVNANINEQAAREQDPNKRARFGMARKASGATTGFPDLTVIVPNGAVCWVEMKSATGTLSDAQRTLHADLEARGQVVVVGRDIWSVQDALKRRGIVVGAAA